MNLTKRAAQRWLAALWVAGFLVLFFTLMLVTMNHPLYELHGTEPWAWFSPVILPTMALIIGVLVAEARSGVKGTTPADPFVFAVAGVLSVSYLSILGIVIVVTTYRETYQIMASSGTYLGLLQGIVTAALGAFFVKEGAKA